ncbi:MAG: EamA family transporter [Leptolyngbya sp.]|nr:EamA family transporter [Leptolyngbya sp.]
MGPIDHLPNDPSLPPQASAANQALKGLSQDLEALRQKVSAQLAEDITYLQNRKQRLMADIETLEDDFYQLKVEYQALQDSQSELLSEQQVAQQQVWAKRLAQALATHLQARLTDALLAPGIVTGGNALNSFSEASDRLSALDNSLHSALKTLQQDLQGYQSSLSQQVSRMHSMEQQGEAILEALVTRLSQELQAQMAQPVQRMPRRGHPPDMALPASQRPPELPTGGSWGRSPSPWPRSAPPPPPPRSTPTVQAQAGVSPIAIASPRRREGAGSPAPSGPSLATPAKRPPAKPAAPPPRASAPGAAGGTSLRHLQGGLILIVLSTLALSIHNVLVGLIGYGGNIFGHLPVTAIFPLVIPNSLLLLWLRMVVVVPLMVIVAQRLRPTVGQDITQLLTQADRKPLFQVIASGSFLFLSQVLIYKAIAEVGPGVAVTLLFMYPLITVPLAWALFGDRPTPLRLVVMVAITMGIVFTALPRISTDLSASGVVSPWGVGAAMLSSVAFALYLVAMQLSFRRLHPVPVSIMQFSTVFVLTSGFLIVGSFFGVQPSEPSSHLGLYLGGLMLGSLTLLGYLFNNYGVKLMGAAQASIVAASGPVVTAMLAYWVIPGGRSTLQFIQWMGVLLVTLGVVSLSLERLLSLKRAARRSELT